jgi:DNA-binding IclR family transcriptional regulator
MRDASNETVSLAVPMHRTAVTIAGLRGRGDIARSIPFGRSVPLHASPAARVMLAHMSDEEIQAYLDGGPLERFTAATAVKPVEIWKEVELIRERGYAMGRGDHVKGATGIGFPVLANDGRPHGSLTIAGPVARLPEQRLEELKPVLLEIVAELNRHSRLYPAVQPSQPTPKR